MIRYLKHNEIDKKKWDECIDNSVNNLIYSCSWYLDIVSPNWNALVEPAGHSSNGLKDDYTSVMPLTTRKKYGVDYLYPPYFAQQLGVFSKNKLSQQKIEEFLNAIPSHYKFIETYLNTQNTFDPDSYRDSGFQIKRNTNIELDLNSHYESLQKNYSDDIKRNIKKAEKHHLSIRKNISATDIIKIFRKNTGRKINNLTTKNYEVLSELISACVKKGFAEIWGAFAKENKLCAGVIWITKADRSIFLFSATNAEAKKSGAMPFLINSFIKEKSNKKMILDFEGSNLPGLARFYKGFGSKETVYLQIRKNKLPKFIRWIKA